MLLSVITRGARFFVLAILLNRYGGWIREKIERHLGLVVLVAALALVLGFVAAVKLF